MDRQSEKEQAKNEVKRKRPATMTKGSMAGRSECFRQI
jgi:hypothetical protein